MIRALAVLAATGPPLSLLAGLALGVVALVVLALLSKLDDRVPSLGSPGSYHNPASASGEDERCPRCKHTTDPGRGVCPECAYELD